MKITYHPPHAVAGNPVFLNEEGKVISPDLGIRLFMGVTEISRDDLARICLVSPRTVEGWFATEPRPIPAPCMLAMKVHLEKFEVEHVRNRITKTPALHVSR